MRNPFPAPHSRCAAFMQVYSSLASSGDLARMSASALKVLHVLGLASSPLGTGSPADCAFFDDLVRKGALVRGDRGKLFCCVSHQNLVRLSGLSKNTITSCTSELVRLGMVEKRVVRTRGFLRYNCFLLLPPSHLDKYHALRPAAAAQSPRSGNGTGVPPAAPCAAPPVPIAGSNLRIVNATTTIDRVIALYEATVGAATPMIRRQLAPLVAQYPDLAQWDAAFCRAAWANVPRLSYVVKVLEGYAEGSAAPPLSRPLHGSRQPGSSPPIPPAGETPAPTRPPYPPSRPASSSSRGSSRPAPDRRQDRADEMEAIRAAQQRALSVSPLDYRACLGLEHA